MRTILEFLNPFHKRGFYAVPGLLLIAAGVVAVLIVIALTAQAVLNAHFYRSHFRAPLRVPHVYKTVKAPPKLANSLPSTGSIHFQYFMTAINDQGDIGSCQSWSFSKQLSYATNWNVQANGTHLHHFFSPRYGYDLVSNGQDAGSYLEQYPPIAETGIPRWIAFPYPPYQVDYPVPTVSPLYRLNTTEHQLFANQGAGSGGLALIKQALSTHHAVNIDMPVYPEYDAATQNSGNVGVPFAGETDRGGHANVAVAFDDSHYNSTEGTYGAVLVSNQWGNQWGTAATSVTGSSQAGYAWLSYNFVETYVWDAAVVHVSTAPLAIRPSLQAGKPFSADGGSTNLSKPPYHFQHGPTTPPPPHAQIVMPGAITSPQAAAAAGYAWHVKNVELTDATDASWLVNHWGDYFHIWPLGIAATIGTESGYNPRAYRWQAGLDKSCGLMQLIVTNVEPIIQNYDPFAACAWEYSAANSIWLGARYYRDAFAYQRGCVQFPQAYGLYNAGYAWPCSFYYNLTGQAASNYYGNFLPNYSWALQHFQDFGPGPKPKPTPKPVHHYKFPIKRWCRYDQARARKCPSPNWHHQLGKVPFTWSHWRRAFHKRGTVDHVCGGVVSAERWGKKLRMEKQRFSHCIAYSWPRFRNDPVKWVKPHQRYHA